MENNDANQKNGDIKTDFEKLCEITGAPPKDVFEDCIHFNNVLEFLSQSDDPVVYIVRSRLFPNGMPSPEEFLTTIVSELKTPEDLNRVIREAKIELLKIRLVYKFRKFVDWVKQYFKF